MFQHGRMLQSDGTIIRALAGGFFRVVLDGGGHVVTCRPNSTIALNRVHLVAHDRVIVELPAASGSLDKGRIVFRYHGRE